MVSFRIDVTLVFRISYQLYTIKVNQVGLNISIFVESDENISWTQFAVHKTSSMKFSQFLSNILE